MNGERGVCVWWGWNGQGVQLSFSCLSYSTLSVFNILLMIFFLINEFLVHGQTQPSPFNK